MTEPKHTQTLLIVEDNETLREALASLLQKEGYQVVLAANGSHALGHLQAGIVPDLILLDLFMPVLDGWRFLQVLQQKASQPPVPIIVMTGSTDAAREWAQTQGCASFVSKPIDPAELLHEVRRLLPPSPQPSKQA
jgi:CheY-like chemotaxis protein